MAPVRLLVVDDSGFMRIAIRKMVAGETGIEVVGEARNGVAAVNMVRELKPDVITMDVEMPDLDGLGATRAIMAERPTPIIMVSSLTQKGAQTTLEALAAGAVDFISKSSSFVQLDITQIDRELREKVVYWGRRPILSGAVRAASAATEPSRRRGEATAADGGLRRCAIPRKVDLVVVGVSTGGPKVVPQFLKTCGPLRCPMVMAQHMPKFYTESFAQHLHQETGLDVREGENGLVMQPGMVVIVPGGRDGVIGHGMGGRKVFNTRFCDDTPIHPSVDVLFESALRITDALVAVILTGMGSDGTRGARRIAERGLPVIVQEPANCVIGGMPQSAIDAGAASHSATIEDIGRRLKEWCG